MILNSKLPQADLEKTFSHERRQQLDRILDILDPKKSVKIIYDEELLGELHHVMNLNNYRKSSFRKKLLQCADLDLVMKFCQKVGMQCKKGTDAEYRKLVTELSKLTWGDNDHTRAFLSTFGYPEFLVPHDGHKSNTTSTVCGRNTLDPLMDYQSHIFYNVIHNIDTPNYRVLVQMPTGSGKTRTAMEIVTHFLNADKTRKVLWLASSRELLDQASSSFEHVWAKNGRFQATIYRIWDTRTVPKTIKECSITIMGFAKYNSIIRQDLDFVPNVELVVVDEAHQILAPTYKRALQKLAGDPIAGTRVLGLTATPGRGMRDDQNIALAQKFNSNILGITKPNYNIDDSHNPVFYLQKNGILSGLKIEPLNTTAKKTFSQSVWKRIKNTNVELNEKDLKTLAESTYRNTEIAKRLKKLLDEGKRILYFGTSREQAIIMYAIIAKFGYRAAYVDGETDIPFREEFVKMFKKGDIQIMFNYEVFTTGFDAPQTDAIIIARPIFSPIRLSQMIGRGLRGVKMGGTESCTLVQVIDSIDHPKEFDPYQSYNQFAKYWQ